MAEEEEVKEAKPKKEKAAESEQPEAVKPSEQKIMCFVSKKMVPLSETVEVEYAPGKKVRVLPKYVKYDLQAAG